MKTTTELVKSCTTCLYRATHDKCDGCLTTKEDYAALHERSVKLPDFRYLNYLEGNWMARLAKWELEGKRNIVIGGQGEAEVNAKRTPEETAKQLHYVAGECGYLCGHLRLNGLSAKIRITVHDYYEIEWSRPDEDSPWRLDYIWQLSDKLEQVAAFWSREICEIWSVKASELNAN